MPPFAQPLEEAACLLELLRSGALREIAADHDQVGLKLVRLALDGLDQFGIVSAKMQVREVEKASHGRPTRVAGALFQ